jgi:hypothetical protein
MRSAREPNKWLLKFSQPEVAALDQSGGEREQIFLNKEMLPPQVGKILGAICLAP